MINLDDLVDHEEKPLKGFRYSLCCDPELERIIKECRGDHGKTTTAELIRRVLLANLPQAHSRLKAKKKK